ncbi:hypothetical protein KHA80_18545 [Anaerobacillus sp. HL2]|nr:hypothetical protein KHA80_18545 [Anaerobacillus sp. HL2]
MDTDIKVYGPLVELENALETHNVVLTPQLLTPQEVINDSVDWEQIVSLKGTFNTGFLAIKRSEEGENFIHWC